MSSTEVSCWRCACTCSRRFLHDGAASDGLVHRAGTAFESDVLLLELRTLQPRSSPSAGAWPSTGASPGSRRAEPCRLHRRLDRAVAGHHESQGMSRPELLDHSLSSEMPSVSGIQMSSRTRSGRTGAALDPLSGLATAFGSGATHSYPSSDEDLVDQGSDVGLVVNDEYVCVNQGTGIRVAPYRPPRNDLRTAVTWEFFLVVISIVMPLGYGLRVRVNRDDGENS